MRRLVFHEITQSAIHDALEHPREIDEGLVRAQETRRIFRSLVWLRRITVVVAKSWSGTVGRACSECRGPVDCRARARAHGARICARNWDLIAKFAKASGESFDTTLVSVDDRRIPRAKDFDSKTGKIKDASLMLLDEAGARSLAERVMRAAFKVSSLDVKPFNRATKGSVYDEYAAARGQSQIGVHGQASDECSSEPVRKRFHNLHAYGFDQPRRKSPSRQREI